MPTDVRPLGSSAGSGWRTADSEQAGSPTAPAAAIRWAAAVAAGLVYQRVALVDGVGVGDGDAGGGGDDDVGEAGDVGATGEAGAILGVVVAEGLGVEGLGTKGCADVGIGVGVDVGVDVGFGVGVDVGIDVGFGVGVDVDVGFDVGFDVGVDVGFGTGGGDGTAVVLLGVGWDRLLDGVGCGERVVAVGVGFGVRVGVGCVMADGGGCGVPWCGVTNAQMPMPLRMSTTAPPAIHGARRGGRR